MNRSLNPNEIGKIASILAVAAEAVNVDGVDVMEKYLGFRDKFDRKFAGLFERSGEGLDRLQRLEDVYSLMKTIDYIKGEIKCQ